MIILSGVHINELCLSGLPLILWSGQISNHRYYYYWYVCI